MIDLPETCKPASWMMRMAGALLLGAILFTPVKGNSQGLPPLARDLNPSETALILVDFQYPFTNTAGPNYRAVKKEIEENLFREDLYHRLSVILIKVPGLEERKDDIALLVNKFLLDIAQEYGSKQKEIDEKGIKELEAHPWTGNVRELRNVVERLVIMSGDRITLEEVKKYL